MKLKLIININKENILYSRNIIKLNLTNYQYIKFNLTHKLYGIIINSLCQFFRIINGVFLLYYNFGINNIINFFILFDTVYVLFNIILDKLVTNNIFNEERSFNIYFKKLKYLFIFYFIFAVFYEIYYLIFGLYLIYYKSKNILIHKILFFNCILKLCFSLLLSFYPNLNPLNPSKEYILNLNILKWEYVKKKNINKEDCSICLNKMNNKIIKLNNCIHCFHSDCIIKWFKQGNISCPICRESLLKLN